jgi:cytochrome d ubiquinol oxidase subunit II
MEKLMFVDYETLRVIWWLLLGFIFIVFAVMGGIDLGVGTLLPFVARNDIEKRVLLNSVGPTWESNQVWFILGGGATFAAWPYVYSVAFSTMYIALFVVLLALILRPVGFDFRSKIDNLLWRDIWDGALFCGGFIPTIVFGVAVGNLLQGINFSFNEFMYLENQVVFLDLFSPFTLLCGGLSLAMIVVQGATFLSMKTKSKVYERSIRVSCIVPFITMLLFFVGGVMINKMPGYVISHINGFDLSSNPFIKKVIVQDAGWLLNYYKYKWFLIAPILGFCGSLFVVIFSLLRINFAMFISSSLSIIGIISTVGFSMFPFIVPSSLNYDSSLTVWDASSSYLSLLIMLLSVIIFVPIILIYVSWAYKVMFGRVDEQYIKKNNDNLY